MSDYTIRLKRECHYDGMGPDSYWKVAVMTPRDGTHEWECDTLAGAWWSARRWVKKHRKGKLRPVRDEFTFTMPGPDSEAGR